MLFRSDAAFQAAHTAGAFYLYPDFAPWRAQLAARGVSTSAELASHLLELWDIATLPASDFGEAPDALRLRLATSLLYVPSGATPDAREAILNDLLEQADNLPMSGDDGPRLALPALDEAAARLAEFVAALQSV